MTAVPVLATLIVLFFAALGALKVAAVPTMAERARHVGFTATSYRWIGLLELAGAAGVALGAVVPWLGVVAAVGLLLLLAGALAAHLRGGDRGRELAPAVVAGLGVLGYLILQLARA
jgi:hypothetical protein